MKSCDKVPAEQLLAYHLNALSPLRRFQLTVHLRGCAACRAELLVEQALDSHLRCAESQTLPAPAPTRQLALRLGGATLALSGLVIGAVLLHPGAPGGPQIAFADVEKALSDSRYITWTQTYSYEIPVSLAKSRGLQKRLSSSSTYWVEVAPLRVVIEDKTQNSRSLNDGSHIESKSQSLYLWMDTRGQEPPSSIKQLILSPMDPSYPDKTPSQYFTTSSTPWQQKTVTLQDKSAIHFQRSTTTRFKSGRDQQTAREEVWVEPETRHLIRRESHIEHNGGFKTYVVAENFRYVNSAPTGTFDPLRPKPGEFYTFANPTGPDRKLLVEDKGIDRAIRIQINQIVSAMNAGDGLRLARLGDAQLYASDGPENLGGKSRAQRSAYLTNYLKYVAQQRVLRNWKIDRLPGLFTSVLSYWHQHAEGDPYPPTGPMEVNVHLSGTATQSDGQRRRVRSLARFRLTPGGPKLIWFNPNNHN